jgi:hypothetical protein
MATGRLPETDAGFIDTNTPQTMTNKTINLASNTLTATIAQINTAISDGDIASLAGSEVLTNKTLTAPTVNDPVMGSATSFGIGANDITTSILMGIL